METQQAKCMGYSKSTSRGKFLVIKSYSRKQEKSQINYLNLYLKEIAKEQQTKPKVKILNKILANNTLKESYNMINWDLFQE